MAVLTRDQQRRSPLRSRQTFCLSSTLRVYFPTLSNGLKNIAGYLGFQWSGSPASGLEAIVWRHRWEGSRDPAKKQALLDYNREDCEALEIVANSLVDLYHAAPADRKSSRSDVVR